MAPNLLILAGTTEARVLARAVAARGISGTVSLAGRVAQPLDQPLPLRIGGFGGVAGLVRYLRDAGITHLIDATHPFAAKMSRHAVAAAAQTGLPMVALSRPAWRAEPGDHWQCVPNIAGAVAALDRPRQRVLLAVGRMHLADFAGNPQHHYVLRLVDRTAKTLPFPDATIITARGPFDLAGDLDLLRAHAIDLVVSKNSGGDGAYAKIAAARLLGLPVIMIDRPEMPERIEFHDLDAVLTWIAHPGTARGV
ncbi:MAG: cobalt-precorrin-6A reductase [Pseudomonadota bacterium]